MAYRTKKHLSDLNLLNKQKSVVFFTPKTSSQDIEGKLQKFRVPLKISTFK